MDGAPGAAGKRRIVVKPRERHSDAAYSRATSSKVATQEAALGNTVFHVRRQAEEALTLATRRTGKLGGWSRDARDPNVLRRQLEILASNALHVCDLLERAS